MAARNRIPPGGTDSMSDIFTRDFSTPRDSDTPRSPYKKPSNNAKIPQSTGNLLHFNGDTYKVPYKPSRRPSQTLLPTTGFSDSLESDSRPQSAASSRSSATCTTSTANSRGMRDVMHHDSTAGFNSSPRKRVAPGGPTSIILR